MASSRFVAYYRVSTKNQWTSGLGIDAQRKSVEDYVKSVSGSLFASFEEVESGSRSDREQLHRAIEMCRHLKGTLVIAKLDRLARNVSFVSGLLEAGIDFLAVDMPYANRLTIHLVAAMAEFEREQISERVRSAMRAAIARGVRVGNPRIGLIQAKAVEAAKQRADQYALRMAPVVAFHDDGGKVSSAKLAVVFQRLGYQTSRGGKRWSEGTVRNLRRRIETLRK